VPHEVEPVAPPGVGHAACKKSGFQKIAEFDDPNDGLVWHWRRERLDLSSLNAAD